MGVCNFHLKQTSPHTGPVNREGSKVLYESIAATISTEILPDIDLYWLQKEVEKRGGYDNVCAQGGWTQIANSVQGINSDWRKLKAICKNILQPTTAPRSKTGFTPINGTKERLEESERARKTSQRMLQVPRFTPLLTDSTVVTPPQTVESFQTDDRCQVCSKSEGAESCHFCKGRYHPNCLKPKGFCKVCNLWTGEYTFSVGPKCTLKNFKSRAKNKVQGQEEIAEGYWEKVEDPTDLTEIEYCPSISVAEQGSGCPTNADDKDGDHDWNLNKFRSNGPLQHVKHIDGITTPWVSAATQFSAISWQVEELYLDTIISSHEGADTEYYFVPGSHFDAFEQYIRETMPTLSKQHKNILGQMVTIINPMKIHKAGIPVYKAILPAGSYLIIFGKTAYMGFYHGYNVSQSVNFTSHEWANNGLDFMKRAQKLQIETVFCPKEIILITARKGTPTEGDLIAATEILETELNDRAKYSAVSDPRLANETQFEGETPTCSKCKTFCSLSHVLCSTRKKTLCLKHATTCCQYWRDQSHKFYVRDTTECLKVEYKAMTERPKKAAVNAKRSSRAPAGTPPNYDVEAIMQEIFGEQSREEKAPRHKRKHQELVEIDPQDGATGTSTEPQKKKKRVEPAPVNDEERERAPKPANDHADDLAANLEKYKKDLEETHKKLRESNTRFHEANKKLREVRIDARTKRSKHRADMEEIRQKLEEQGEIIVGADRIVEELESRLDEECEKTQTWQNLHREESERASALKEGIIVTHKKQHDLVCVEIESWENEGKPVDQAVENTGTNAERLRRIREATRGALLAALAKADAHERECIKAKDRTGALEADLTRRKETQEAAQAEAEKWRQKCEEAHTTIGVLITNQEKEQLQLQNQIDNLEDGARLKEEELRAQMTENETCKVKVEGWEGDVARYQEQYDTLREQYDTVREQTSKEKQEQTGEEKQEQSTHLMNSFPSMLAPPEVWKRDTVTAEADSEGEWKRRHQALDEGVPLVECQAAADTTGQEMASGTACNGPIQQLPCESLSALLRSLLPSPGDEVMEDALDLEPRAIFGKGVEGDTEYLTTLELMEFESATPGFEKDDNESFYTAESEQGSAENTLSHEVWFTAEEDLNPRMSVDKQALAESIRALCLIQICIGRPQA